MTENLNKAGFSLIKKPKTCCVGATALKLGPKCSLEKSWIRL